MPGKQLPGEKQRLKRSKVDAKRAARAAAKGFDAAAIVSQLEAFVLAEGDMKVRRRYDIRPFWLPSPCHAAMRQKSSEGAIMLKGRVLVLRLTPLWDRDESH